ncbi:hypothetical protein M9Y10_012014 [Tritrichomonas musculus]|uniref:Uncharacterized protein n=1 Tax=Tritrichomonas musculus TaxID=1915356 RepID=A0ABR2IBI2_9EUKA
MFLSESILTCAFFSASGILLLAGIPCWVIGILIPRYYMSDFLYSIPIFPESTDDVLSLWSFPSKDDRLQSSNKLVYPISISDFPKKHLGKKINVHILHNLWGIKMSGSILKNNVAHSYFKNEFNLKHEKSEFFNRSISPGDLPKQFRQYGEYRVKCPFSTLITQENQIEPKCSRKIGSFMHLNDLYEEIIIGNVKVEERNSISIVFDELKVLPYDFVFTPQMYIGFWKKTLANKLAMSGTILTVSGIIVLIISIVVFFACSPSGDDVGTDRN